MKRTLLLSICALLLGLPAATAFCASCVSGACAQMVPREAPVHAEALSSHAEAPRAPQEEASRGAMPPCHAAMMAGASESATPEKAAPERAESPERAEEESAPCHGDDAQPGPATAAMGCCDGGLMTPPALAGISGGSSTDAHVAAPLQATRVDLSQSPTRTPTRLGERPPETRSALHVLHAVWLI